MKYTAALLASVSTTIVCAYASTVSAQTANPAATGIDEVVVTAQRREQSLISVPMSIQAYSGEQLVEAGIKDMTSLQFTSPGLLPDTSNGFTSIYIRGVGNQILIGADPSVATFIDDVPQIYGQMIDSFIGVDRVEILKGAQGGLYGRNATAGVINIITPKPQTDRFFGKIRGSYGTKNTLDLSGQLNIPLGDKAAFVISGLRASHDPYVRNTASNTPLTAAMFPSGAFLPVANGTAPVAPGVYAYTPAQTAAFFNRDAAPSAYNDQDVWAFKSKLLLDLAPNFSVTFAGGYAKKRDNAGGQFVDITPWGTNAALPALFGSFGITTAFPPNLAEGATGKWSLSQSYPTFTHTNDGNLSATAVWSGPNVDLTSITAFRKQRTRFVGDAVSSTIVAIPLELNFKRKYVYQEFRAVSAFDGPLQLIGGATYLDNRQRGQTDVYFLSTAFQIGDTAVRNRVRNWSAYLNAEYDLSERLSVAVSGRYIREKNTAVFTMPAAAERTSVQSKFVPSATIRYDIDNGNVYARWARGFKTGGVNITTPPSVFPRPTDGSVFGPETVDTYELGYKQALFDRRVQLTVAAFYNSYSNIQVDVRPKPAFTGLITQALVNAKSARTYGVEGSVSWRVSDELSLGVNGGYLNAKYKDFSLSGSEVLSDFNLNGQQMPKAPKFQLSASADLNVPVTEKFNFISNVLASHSSSVIFIRTAAPGYLPDAIGPSYWVVNARAGIQSADERYSLSVIVDNLLDNKYYISGVSSAYNVILNYGNRRIIRAELSANF